jgi:membrane-bound serine protease (ClpP class)
MRARSKIWRVLCRFVVIGAILAGPASGADEKQTEFSRPVLIQVTGPITPLLEQYLYRKLQIARDHEADLLILEVDSPGGFVATTLNIGERLRDLSWARTVAYIPREAISGAAIISLACDDILMAPQGRLGDAGQIMLGKDNAFRYVPEKERSVLVRHVRDLALAKGRPPALAEAMVDMDLEVYHVKNSTTGDETYMSEPELASAEDPAVWEKIKLVHESRAKHFLTVNGLQAVELQLAAGTAETREQVAQRYALTNRPLVLQHTTFDTAITILNWRFVTAVLLVVGLIALYVEFSASGIGIGALVSCLCFAVFFWSRFLGGTAGWLEVVLFGVGVLFVLMEVVVVPGFGVAGISGLLLMVASVLMASQHFIIPSTDLEMSAMVGSLLVIVGSGIASVIAAVGISHYLGTIPVIGWMVLEPQSRDGQHDEDEETADRYVVQVGDQGVAESSLRPAGRALFDGRHVNVVADGSFVDPGRPVRVIDVSGNRIVVRERT